MSLTLRQHHGLLLNIRRRLSPHQVNQTLRAVSQRTPLPHRLDSGVRRLSRVPRSRSPRPSTGPGAGLPSAVRCPVVLFTGGGGPRGGAISGLVDAWPKRGFGACGWPQSGFVGLVGGGRWEPLSWWLCIGGGQACGQRRRQPGTGATRTRSNHVEATRRHLIAAVPCCTSLQVRRDFWRAPKKRSRRFPVMGGAPCFCGPFDQDGGAKHGVHHRHAGGNSTGCGAG